jgi:putative hemolysin
MLIDCLIIVFLILLNGVFAMTELAVVSSRKNRLVALADAGSRGARIALELKEDPSKFLSTIQIGITLIGIFSGAFSGVTIAGPLGHYFSEIFPSLGTRADDLAIAVVVTVVTYFSLVIGELVPKQVALRYADIVAVAIALPISWLSVITKPVVFILDISNRVTLALLGIGKDTSPSVSEEDVKAAIAEGAASGTLEPEEKQMMDRVMRLDDIPITAAMTHRKDIVWIDESEGPQSILNKIRDSRHSRYLLCSKSIENVLGILVLKDVLLQMGHGDVLNLKSIVQKPLYIPDSQTVLEALEKFKQSATNIAIIMDEYGTLEGLVTLKDIMEAIVGTLPEPAHREDFAAVQREDGSWLVDGGLSVHEAEEALGIKNLAAESDTFTTIAGFMLAHLGHIPKATDSIEWQGWHFEVVDMDGKRIDKILVQNNSK